MYEKEHKEYLKKIRPYKQKKRTRATIAKEKGLQPLADMIFGQKLIGTLEDYASAFVDSEKGVETIEDAVQGAKDSRLLVSTRRCS